MDSQLLVDTLQMGARRCRRDEQSLADLLFASAVGGEVEYFALTFCEVAEVDIIDLVPVDHEPE